MADDVFEVQGFDPECGWSGVAWAKDLDDGQALRKRYERGCPEFRFRVVRVSPEGVVSELTEDEGR